MRLFVTGDTHGNACSEFEKLNSTNFPVGKSLTSEDIVVILGDFGLLFKPDLTREEFYWLNWLSEKPWTTLFIDGNHENFERLNTLPESSKWGGKVGVVDLSIDTSKMKKPIYHLKRGQVFEINGKKIFTMGGALSIDKVYRTPYISWWPQEDVNYAEMEEAYTNLEKVDNKVDFIFTHTCPNNEIDTIFP
jgi:predicted phosphodiesterase